MLARSGKLKHPLGGLIDLPRLVPAFSSKGFPFLRSERMRAKARASQKGRGAASGGRVARRDISETTLALELVGPWIKDSILVSAYDLYHRHLRRPERFFADKEVVFIDSGGYELGPGFDPTEPIHLFTPKKRFSREDYVEVLGSLSADLPFAVANFDWGTRRKPLVDQILAGQKLFRRFGGFLRDFIVKPVGDERYLNIDEIIRHVAKFRAFDILGIAEKDLGMDLIERLKAVARLRLAMDRENVAIPIHVWGGLDPLLSPMYFFAGAEIFDGISWLRYAYIDGVATYRDSYSILAGTIETPTDHARGLALSHNLESLRGLATGLRDFVLHGGKTFDMFGRHAAAIEKAYRSLVTKVPAIEGGQ